MVIQFVDAKESSHNIFSLSFYLGTAANAIRSNLEHNQLEHVLDEWDEMDFDEEEEESEGSEVLGKDIESTPALKLPPRPVEVKTEVEDAEENKKQDGGGPAAAGVPPAAPPESEATSPGRKVQKLDLVSKDAASSRSHLERAKSSQELQAQGICMPQAEAGINFLGQPRRRTPRSWRRSSPVWRRTSRGTTRRSPRWWMSR